MGIQGRYRTTQGIQALFTLMEEVLSEETEPFTDFGNMDGVERMNKDLSWCAKGEAMDLLYKLTVRVSDP